MVAWLSSIMMELDRILPPPGLPPTLWRSLGLRVRVVGGHAVGAAGTREAEVRVVALHVDGLLPGVARGRGGQGPNPKKNITNDAGLNLRKQNSWS